MANIVDSRPRKNRTGTVTLVIENFSKFDSYKFESLKIDEGSIIFGFRPKIDIQFVEYASIYLLNLTNQKMFNFHLKVSILKFNGYKVYTKEYQGAFDYMNEYISFSLMPHYEILLLNGCLVDDKLTLLCELTEQSPNNANNQDLNNLSGDFQTLLQNGKLSDATLIVGADRKQLHVHKTILVARSPVFAAMFEHDCEEKRLNKVTLTDMDQETCEEMVRYIYTDKVRSLDRYAMDLLEVADKYQLDSLKNICGDYLSATLSIESAANVLILADLHHATNLKTKCIEYILQNIDQVETTDGWKPLETNAKLLCELFFYSAKKK